MSLSRKILPIVMLLMVGCGSPSQLATFIDTDPEAWYSPVELRFEVDDTLNIYNMELLARYTNSISADSLQLLISVTAPDGVMWSEPFTLHTLNKNNSIEMAQSSYRENIRWSQRGEYRISLTPQQIYKGVNNVGVEIIKKGER